VLVGTSSDISHGTFSLFAGDGTGRLGFPINTPTPLSEIVYRDVFWMAAGELNGDGYPDLLVVELTSGTPLVYGYLNNHDGTFKQTQSVFPIGEGFEPQLVVSVALGDLNEDGCADAVGLDTWGLVNVALGRCDGSFAEASSVRHYATGDTWGALALADVNGDGHLDVIATGSMTDAGGFYGGEAGNLLSVLLGDGRGKLGPARVYRGDLSAFALTLADLNQDGLLDAIKANQESDSVNIFLNDGKGGFGQPEGEYIGHYRDGLISGVTNSPQSALIPLDLNADSKTDLVLLQAPHFYPETYPITSLLNNGQGRFGLPVLSPGLETTLPGQGDIVVADFRNTGHADFLAIGGQFSNGGPFISFNAGQGDGTFSLPSITQPDGAQGVVGVGDFNRDGRLDFVAANYTGPASERQRLTVFRGQGNGTFAAGPSMTFGGSAGGSATSVFVADFNQDGKLDVLVHLVDSLVGVLYHDVFQFLGNGDGSFGTGRIVLQQMSPITLADLNKDGLMDVIESADSSRDYPEQTPAEIKIYLGRADGSFELRHTYAPYAGLASTPRWKPGPLLGDFNGDGNADVAVYQRTRYYWQTPYVQVLLGNGDGSFTPSYNVYDPSGFELPHLAVDLTGDGRADTVELDGYTASFNVVPATPGPALQLHLLPPYPLIGTRGRARVSLNIPSDTATEVALSASDPAITLPSSLTLAPGAVDQEFEYTLGAGFDSHRTFQLRAQLGNDVAVAHGFRADPSMPVGFAVTLSHGGIRLMVGAASSNLTAWVTSVGGYETTVSFDCANLPADTSCLFSTESEPLARGGTAVAGLTISAGPAAPPGVHNIKVRASDDSYSAQANLTLEVYANRPPVANAGPDATWEASAPEGAKGYLRGWNSYDPDGGALTYTWTGPFSEGGGTVTGVSPIVTLVPGVHIITLVVSDGELTSTDTVQITVSDFALSVPQASATVRAGQTASYTINIAPQFGPYNNAIGFACSNLPDKASCSFTPPYVALGASPSSVTLKVATTAPSGSSPRPLRPPWAIDVRPETIWLVLGWLAAFAATLTLRRSRQRLAWHFALGLVAGCMMWLSACGGGGGPNLGGSNPPPPTPGTPPGTYTLTVTAVAGNSRYHSTTVRLTVE
jgi:hypothetical protein